MHIGVVSEHFHKLVSGPRRAFLNMADELARLGHELSLVGISRRNDVETIPGGQARLHKYSWKIIPVRLGRPRYFARKLARIHARKPLDVVWAMGLEPAAAALKFRNRAGVPFVLNPRSFLMEKPGDWKFDRTRQLINECDAFVALTDMGAERWCEALGYPRDDKIFGVINGVRANELEGETSKPDGVGDGLMILSMGMLRGPKGHHFVIRALAQLKDLPWQLVIAGEGPWKQKLQELAAAHKLSKRVHFVGLVKGAQWRWLYRNAEVFALYSVYAEACGNAFLEAQAAGLPIITSDQGSLPEVVPHEVVGLINQREPKATEIDRLAQTLKRVLTDKTLREKLGKASKQRASQLTWRRCVEGYLDAMNMAIKRGA